MMESRKQLVLLGATGSIGDSTLMVARKHPERIGILAIAGNRRWRELAGIANEFGVRHVAIFDEAAARDARRSGDFPAETKFYDCLAGLCEIATLPEADTVVAAIVGTTSLHPALAAIHAGKQIALASKEILVMAGEFVMQAARKAGVDVLPLDSEHNAIFQCLQGEDPSTVAKILLTASGGPFRDYSAERMTTITKADALRHPNWSMGPKITIDSATMANKGLEIIEARWLFDLEPDQIEAVVHPQSIVHSMVQYIDGSVIAQMAPPHMTFAIQHALLYPQRAEGCVATLDFSKAMTLEFRQPDYQRFPTLGLALASLGAGGGAPAAFNAANEIAVERFMADQITFGQIPSVIEGVLAAVDGASADSLEAIVELDQRARFLARAIG